MVFCFVQNFFFGQHKSYNIYLFCCAKREFFFQSLALGYMTKTLNQIIFFSLHHNQNIFFSNIENQNIFLEKNHNPPFKLNGRSLTTFCESDPQWVPIKCETKQKRNETKSTKSTKWKRNETKPTKAKRNRLI